MNRFNPEEFRSQSQVPSPKGQPHVCGCSGAHGMDVSLWIPKSPLHPPLGPAADSSTGCLGPLHVLLSKVGFLRFKCPILSHIRDGQLDIMIIMIYRWSHDVVPPVSWPFIKLGLPRGFPVSFPVSCWDDQSPSG